MGTDIADPESQHLSLDAVPQGAAPFQLVRAALPTLRGCSGCFCLYVFDLENVLAVCLQLPSKLQPLHLR